MHHQFDPSACLEVGYGKLICIFYKIMLSQRQEHAFDVLWASGQAWCIVDEQGALRFKVLGRFQTRVLQQESDMHRL